MLLRAVLKTISLFLCLAAFMAVGIHSLTIGEELLWAVGKAFVAFIISWIVINWLAGILLMSVEGLQCGPQVEPARAGANNGAPKRGAGAEG